MAWNVPLPALQTVVATLHLPGPHNSHETILTVAGLAETRRVNLWTYSETWSYEQQQQGLEPCDAAHHILLAARQDRPNSREQLDRSLRGEPAWEQLHLW
jgi:hypothetical protein